MEGKKMADPGISDEYSSRRSGFSLLHVFSFGVEFGVWSAFRVIYLSLEIGLLRDGVCFRVVNSTGRLPCIWPC